MLYIEIIDNKVTQSTPFEDVAKSEFKTYITTEFEDYTPLNNKYVYKDGAIILNPDYEKEQLEKERERLDSLFLTTADVERAIYRAKGMDFEDLINLVKDNPEIDLKALKIELKANNFYRGNPYINQIGLILGFTETQLDEFFETNDYKELLPVEEPKEDSNSAGKAYQENSNKPADKEDKGLENTEDEVKEDGLVQ